MVRHAGYRVSARCGTGQGRRMYPVQSDQQSPWLDMGSVRSVCRDSQSLCVAVCPDEPDLGHYPPFRLCGEHLGDDPQKPADCHRWISHRCPWCHSGSETFRRLQPNVAFCLSWSDPGAYGSVCEMLKEIVDVQKTQPASALGAEACRDVDSRGGGGRLS